MTTTPAWMRTQRATFTPKRTDDLKPGTDALIGQSFEWRGLWVVTEEDGGNYVGQTLWELVDAEVARKHNFGWVPDEDLTAEGIA